MTGSEISLVAKANEVSRQAIYKEMKVDPEFADQVVEARDFADETIVRALFKRAQKETSAAKFWLTNRRLGEWAIRHHLAGRITHDHIEYTAQIGKDGTYEHTKITGEEKVN